MSLNDVPPVPYKTPMIDKAGLPTWPWAVWFRQVLTRIGGNLPLFPITIANGGTGTNTQQSAIDTLTGTQSSGKYLRSDGVHATLSAIQAADVPTLNQNTTGTAANITGTVAIANGGTGQTTASGAINALLPSQTGNSGKYLTTDGAAASWGAISGFPSGATIAFPGFTAPTGWLMCDGSAVSRTTYAALFAAISSTQNGTTTIGTNSITGLTSTAGFAIGMPVSGTGIPANTTIASIVSGTSITISQNATASGTVPVTIAPSGVGDGSTTFNVPNLQGVFPRGAGSQTIGGIAYSATLGQAQGDQMQGHVHQYEFGQQIQNLPPQIVMNGNAGGGQSPASSGGPASDGTNGTPRVGAETRPANVGVNWIVKT